MLLSVTLAFQFDKIRFGVRNIFGKSRYLSRLVALSTTLPTPLGTASEVLHRGVEDAVPGSCVRCLI